MEIGQGTRKKDMLTTPLLVPLGHGHKYLVHVSVALIIVGFVVSPFTDIVSMEAKDER